MYKLEYNGDMVAGSYAYTVASCCLDSDYLKRYAGTNIFCFIHQLECAHLVQLIFSVFGK